MVLGCGIDIEEHRRFLKFFHSPERAQFFLSIFTSDELENYLQFDSPLCHAVGFSCKEAFYKAFNSAFGDVQIDWREVGLFFQDEPRQGIAEVKFRGAALELARKHHVIHPPVFHYSISDAHVVFETVLECNKN
jgi:phosphopantetheinyl transferase (holo-ACP synthase)